jgi:secreted trypsin-like serine protease
LCGFNEGTCSGDSGGPAFWEPDEDTRILVGITSWGDLNCIATGFNYRVDIPETLTFIADYLP